MLRLEKDIELLEEIISGIIAHIQIANAYIIEKYWMLIDLSQLISCMKVCASIFNVDWRKWLQIKHVQTIENACFQRGKYLSIVSMSSI